MLATYAPIDLAGLPQGQSGFVLHGEDSHDWAGYSVAPAGDVNGDGFADLIIGAPHADAANNAKSYAGAVYLVFGRAAGFGAEIDLGAVAQGQGGFVIQGEDAYDRSGSSVASAGDINGDGFGDLIIGARFADAAGNATPYAGAAYLVFGHATGFGAAIDLASVAKGQGGFVLQGDDRGDNAGVSVCTAGDINGDGFADLIVGAYRADNLAGAAYVVFGKAGVFGASIDLAAVAQGQGGFVLKGEDADDGAGWSVATAGDVNGDGFADLIVGATGVDAAGNAKPAAGGAYVVFGRAGGFGAEIDLRAVARGQGGFVLYGEDEGDSAGWSVASAGDVNGDGFVDVIIGARLADASGNAKFQAGAAYVVFGQGEGFGAKFDLGAVAQGQGGFVIQGEDPSDQAGISVASAGDVNGDGFADLIVGASGADAAANSSPEAGAAYVVFGKAASFGAAIDLAAVAHGQGGFVIYGEDAGDSVGRSIASAGDVNGDGFGDLLIGALGGDAAGNAKSSAGDNYVVFGGAFQPGPAGTTGDDSLLGGVGAQGMDGGAGNDVLRGKDGNDTSSGGDGNDRLIGARGADVLSGGQGKDRFVFDDNALGAIDRILDFDPTEGDRIVLRAIDAIAGTPADDAFTIIGTAAFSRTAGELRWADIGRGVQRIEGDVNGDGAADLVIDVANAAAPVAAGWFVL